MNFRFSRHALEELARRGLTRSVIDDVLANPDQVLVENVNKKVFQSKVAFERGKLFLVRVVVAFDADPPLVVTAYRTSKIDKYWS